MRGGRFLNSLRGRFASGTSLGSAVPAAPPTGTIFAAPGSYNITGTDATLKQTHILDATTGGSYAITGTDATLIDSVPDAVGGGALILAETDAMGIDFTYFTDVTKQMSVVTSSTPVNSAPANTLTYTSPSVKMVRQSDGVYRYANHNLAVRSQEFDNGVVWTKQTGVTITANSTTAPDGTSTADTLVERNGTSQAQYTYQAINTIAGVPYVFSCWAKAATRSWFFLDIFAGTDYIAYFDLANGVTGTTVGSGVTASIVSAGSGWYKCSIRIDTLAAGSSFMVHGATTADNTQAYTGNGSDAIYLWGSQSKRYPVNDANGFTYATGYIATPASTQIFDLPYEWNAALASQGILIEEARTNLLVQSQNLTTTWANNSSTETANSTTAPDGTTTADTITASAGSSNHDMYQTITPVASGAAGTFSAFVKKGTHPYILLNCESDSGAAWYSAVFNLDSPGSAATQTAAGAGDSATVISTSVVDAGNGWYRISLTGSIASATAAKYPAIGFAQAATGNTFDSYGVIVWTAAGTETFYAWGMQMETGAFPTSPIHTIAATVTRAVDTISIATSAIPFSTTVGSMVSSVIPAAGVTLSTQGYGAFHDGTDDERILLFDDGNLFVTNSGVSSDNLDGSGMTAGVAAKIAGAWQANDAAVVVNGGSVTDDDGSVSLPSPTPTTLTLAKGGLADRPMTGYLRQLTYLKRRATNGELATRTT